MNLNTEKGNLSRLEFLIAFCLKKYEAENPVKAFTLNELREYCPTKQSHSTFYRAIKSLHKKRYIELGLKDGKNDTYYLSELGILFVKECC